MKKGNNIVFTVVSLVAEIGFLVVMISSRVASWFSVVVLLMIAKNVYLLYSAYNNSSQDNSDEDNWLGMEKIFLQDETVRKIIEKQSKKAPSEDFAAFAVFKYIDKQHEEFEQIVRSINAGGLKSFLTHSYNEFINNPESVGFTPALINKNNNDTAPEEWNTDIFKLKDGEYAVLLYMPIHNEVLAARLIGVVLTVKGDEHYYCFLNKDAQTSSAVFYRNGKNEIIKIGEVKGLGVELMHQFLGCIKNNFFRLNSWEKYYQYYKNMSIRNRNSYAQHQEVIHILRLEKNFSVNKLSDECTSLADFISGISNEMYKAAVRISGGLSEKDNKKNYTFFYYQIDNDSDFYELSPEKATWFYMLLNREKVVHFLERYQLNKLDHLLAADFAQLLKSREIPENCMLDLLRLRRFFVDSECSVFKWEYIIGKGGRESNLARLYAYHMGCSEELAVSETEKVLDKMVAPTLKTLYPEWEMAISKNTVYMARDYEDMSAEDWLSFEHPFFKEHSKNPADSAKQYYDLFYSESWPYRNISICGYVERIEYKSANFSGIENDHILSVQYAEEYSDFYGFNYGYNKQTLKLEYISEYSGDVSVNVEDCEIPCEGWYEKEDRRFLINPLGMTGLFEFCDVIEDWTPEGDYTITGTGRAQ